jgi:hypothetical protein
VEVNEQKSAPESDPSSRPPDQDEVKAPLDTEENAVEVPTGQSPEQSTVSTDKAFQDLPAADAQGSPSAAQELPSPRKNLAYRLFSPETRLGRIIRPVLRWLAAIAGLFALGLLAGYILLYQPTQRELNTALSRLAETNQVVSQKNQGLETAQTGLDQAQLSLKQVQSKLDAAASENSLLIVMVEISNARVALVEKDGAAAKTAIERARSNLSLALPYIETQDKVLSDLLTSRLELSAKELVSDPQAAQSDLGKLATDLANLHQKIFGD